MVEHCDHCVAWKELHWPYSADQVQGKLFVIGFGLSVLATGLLASLGYPQVSGEPWDTIPLLVISTILGAVAIITLRYFWPRWYARNWRGEIVHVYAHQPTQLHVHPADSGCVPDPAMALLEINLAHPKQSRLLGAPAEHFAVSVTSASLFFLDEHGAILPCMLIDRDFLSKAGPDFIQAMDQQLATALWNVSTFPGRDAVDAPEASIKIHRQQ